MKTLCIVPVAAGARANARPVKGINISSITATEADLVLRVESGETLSGCPDCSEIAIVRRHWQVLLRDIPRSAGQCGCFGTIGAEEHPLAGARAKLLRRPVGH
jgi:hypothetical protein